MNSVALASIAALTFFVLLLTQAYAVPVGQPCGGPAGAACDRGLWCEPPTGLCPTSTSVAGVCVSVPRLCFARKKSKDFKPVCGCNSKTYSSDCFRRAYKVAKYRDGKCEQVSGARGQQSVISDQVAPLLP